MRKTLVRRAVQHHDLGNRTLPNPLKQLRLVLHSDAAFQSARGGVLQAGCVVATTDDRLAQREMAPWSLLTWRNYKMERIVSSTLVAETQSLLIGLGHAEWVAAHLAEMRCPDVDIERRAT